MTNSLSNKLYFKKQLYGIHMMERTMMLDHLNFFNKVINELLAINVKNNKEDKALILLSSLLESYDHILPPCYMVRNLSSWKRSRQLSYPTRSEKDQIKLSRKDRVWWPWEGREKEERKVWFVKGALYRPDPTDTETLLRCTYAGR